MYFVDIKQQPDFVTDVFERPLRCLRVSVTDRCNLRCRYCMPSSGVPILPKKDILDYEELISLVESFVDVGVRKVRITGGEPLLRKGLHHFVSSLAEIRELNDIALTTNGLLLRRYASVLKESGLHRITVSLDTLRQDRFEAITRKKGFESVLEGIASAHEVGFKNIKMDVVVIRNFNDDEIGDLLEFGRTNHLEVRFIEYMDVGGAVEWCMDDVFSGEEILNTISESFGPVSRVGKDGWAPANRYMLDDGTVFGIISSTTSPFCSTCDRARLMANGQWLNCLYAREGFSLGEFLREGKGRSEVTSLIRANWSSRRNRGALDRALTENRGPFVGIGGLASSPHLAMSSRGG